MPGRTCRGSWLNRLIVLDNHSTCILVYSTRPNKLHFSFFGWDLLFKFDNHVTEVYNWSVHASPLVLEFLLRSLQVCLCKPTTRPSASLREKPEAGRLLPTLPRDQISQAGSMLLFLRRVAPHSCLGEIKLQRGAKTGSWTQPTFSSWRHVPALLTFGKNLDIDKHKRHLRDKLEIMLWEHL